jgi:hypothetical protein
MRTRVAYLIGLVMLASAVVHPQNPRSEIVTEPEAYDVYSTVIGKLWPNRNAHATNIIVQAETFTFMGCEPRGKPLEEDWKAAWENFKAKDSQVKTLMPQFPPMGLPYRIVTTADIRSALAGPDIWATFHEMFPDSGAITQSQLWDSIKRGLGRLFTPISLADCFARMGRTFFSKNAMVSGRQRM